MIFAIKRHFEFTHLEIINSRSCMLPSVVWIFGLLTDSLQYHPCNNYYYALNSHVGMSDQRKIVVGHEHQLVGQ